MPRRTSGRGLARTLALAQGAYFVATGLWPLASMSTFERVTGPKREHWLVDTVGVLVTAIGAGLLATARREPPREVALIGAGAALGLAAIDTVFAVRRRISPVYLADAVVEVALAAAWGLARVRGGRVRA